MKNIFPLLLLIVLIGACKTLNKMEENTKLSVIQEPAIEQWLSYKGNGKMPHIVLVSGDEEYRSEEALPQLAKILS